MKFIFIVILILTNFLTYKFHSDINGYLSNISFKQHVNLIFLKYLLKILLIKLSIKIYFIFYNKYYIYIYIQF